MTERRLVIESSLDEVPSVGTAVREVARGAGVIESDAAMLELAVVEAVNNVIEHAYANASGPIEVLLQVTDEAFTVTVIDRGRGADSSGINTRPPEPPTPDRFALEEGGRGLSIIHAVFDTVEYESEGSGNRLQLSKRLSK